MAQKTHHHDTFHQVIILFSVVSFLCHNREEVPCQPQQTNQGSTLLHPTIGSCADLIQIPVPISESLAKCILLQQLMQSNQISGFLKVHQGMR